MNLEYQFPGNRWDWQEYGEAMAVYIFEADVIMGKGDSIKSLSIGGVSIPPNYLEAELALTGFSFSNPHIVMGIKLPLAKSGKVLSVVIETVHGGRFTGTVKAGIPRDDDGNYVPDHHDVPHGYIDVI